MKRIIVASLLALALAACASIQNPLNRDRLAVAVSGYGLAQTQAVTYRTLCIKHQLGPLQANCRDNVVKIAAIDRAAQSAITDANAFILANPSGDATLVITAVESAVTAFQNILAAYGAK